MVFRWILLIALVIPLAGCAILGPARIEISDATLLEAKVSGVSAEDLNFRCICDSSTIETTTPVFLTLRNRGGEADQLIKVETERAVRVEFRRGNGEDDLTSAEPLQVVDIPALGQVEFNRGKYYMILTGVKEDIKPGETISLTLTFAKSGTRSVDAVAKER